MPIASIVLELIMRALTAIEGFTRARLFVHFLMQVRKISLSPLKYVPGGSARVRHAALEMKFCLVYQKVEVPSSPLVPTNPLPSY